MMTSASQGAVPPPRSSDTNALSGSAHSRPVLPNRTSISNSIARTLSREKSNMTRDQHALDLVTSREASRVTLTREEQLDTFDATDDAYREELRGELARLSRDDSRVSVKNTSSSTKARRDSL